MPIVQLAAITLLLRCERCKLELHIRLGDVTFSGLGDDPLPLVRQGVQLCLNAMRIGLEVALLFLQARDLIRDGILNNRRVGTDTPNKIPDIIVDLLGAGLTSTAWR